MIPPVRIVSATTFVHLTKPQAMHATCHVATAFCRTKAAIAQLAIIQEPRLLKSPTAIQTRVPTQSFWKLLVRSRRATQPAILLRSHGWCLRTTMVRISTACAWMVLTRKSVSRKHRFALKMALRGTSSRFRAQHAQEMRATMVAGRP